MSLICYETSSLFSLFLWELCKVILHQLERNHVLAKPLTNSFRVVKYQLKHDLSIIERSHYVIHFLRFRTFSSNELSFKQKWGKFSVCDSHFNRLVGVDSYLA